MPKTESTTGTNIANPEENKDNNENTVTQVILFALILFTNLYISL